MNSAGHRVIFNNKPTSKSDARSITYTTGHINFSNVLANNISDAQIDFKVDTPHTTVNLDISIFSSRSGGPGDFSYRLYRVGSSTPVATGKLRANGLRMIHISKKAELGNYFLIVSEQYVASWDIGITVFDNYKGGGEVRPEPKGLPSEIDSAPSISCNELIYGVR